MVKFLMILMILFLTSCDQTSDEIIKSNPTTDKSSAKQSIINTTNKNIITFLKVPDSVGFKKFQTENYVELDDFEFGQYLPMICFETIRFSHYTPLYKYAILSNETKTIEQGETLYEQLNNKLNNKAIVNYIGPKFIDKQLKGIEFYLEKNRVVNVSTDLGEITVMRIEHNESSGYDDAKFRGFLSMYKKSHLIKTNKISDNDTLSDVLYYMNMNMHNYYSEFIFYDNKINENLYFEEECKYQMVNEDWILVYKGISDIDSDDEEIYTDKNIDNGETYLINIKTNETRYVGNYIYQAIVSPDLKYVMYAEKEDPLFSNHDINGYSNMPKGFFIKNLETNKTLFITHPSLSDKNDFRYEVVNWIDKEKFFELIK